jgi:hypothetical protein
MTWRSRVLTFFAVVDLTILIRLRSNWPGFASESRPALAIFGATLRVPSSTQMNSKRMQDVENDRSFHQGFVSCMFRHRSALAMYWEEDSPDF